jgi:hypothetical protein
MGLDGGGLENAASGREAVRGELDGLLDDA